MSDLKSKTVSGIKWSGISQFGRLGTQILTTIVLARLLLPSDFGLVGMAMVVVGFINIFKDLGTTAAVIQRQELSNTLLSSIFWVNVCFGFLFAFILFLAAPIIGVFYREPRIVSVLQVLSTSLFVSALGILHQALLERTLTFNSLAKLEIGSLLLGAIVGIGMAFGGAGVWSLVFQSLTTTVSATIFLWLTSSWRPQWIFRWMEIRQVGSFSLNLVGFNLYNYAIRNADYLLIGRYLGAQELGYYTLAYRILLFPVQNLAAVIGRVLYPVLSTFQDDNNRFSSAYLKVTASIALVSFPLMLGVMALARPFILTLFGQTWEPVILLMTILAPVGLVQSIGTTVGTIYQAKGRTDWMFRWGLGAGVLIILSFIIGLRWGIVGVAAGYAVVSLVLIYPSFAIPFRLIDLKVARMVRLLRPAFFNSLLMLVVLTVLRPGLSFSLPDPAVLAVGFGVGLILYSLASYLTNPGQLRELWTLSGLKRIIIHEAE